MSRFSEKGYYIKENAPIYFTENMDNTAKWFEDILGWYSNIVERDGQGNGCYGAVFEILPEVEITHLAPFTGFHMFMVNHKKELYRLCKCKELRRCMNILYRKGGRK